MTTLAEAPPKLHPTDRYAHAVVNGDIPAGELVRLACARHLRDRERENTPGFPFHFDEEKANDGFDFFEFELCHYEGDMAGEPFELIDWQMFVLGSVYGWVDRRGKRRFKRVFILTGKGSGKTPMCAGSALKAVKDPNQPGAQVYFAATTREQAALGFRDSKAMARLSPSISSVVHITEHAITFGNSYMQTVSSEAGNIHGKRPYVAVIDEIHVHPNDEVVEGLRAGSKRIEEWLQFMPTNAGQDRRSLAWRYHEYTSRILKQVVTDEEWFGYVCQLDVCETHKDEGKDMPVDNCETGCDQWTDERVWLKANPSLEVTPGIQYLRGQVNEAKNMPAKADNVKRLNFCIWTSGKVQWIRPEVWRKQEPRREIVGRNGFGGYDFSAVNDLTAAAYVFPDDDGIDIEMRVFVPEERIDEIAERTKAPIRQWVDAGHIKAIPGSTINYHFVEAEDERVRETYEIPSSAIDPWQSIQFRADLEEKGVQIVTLPQTNQRLHAVVEEAERLMSIGQFRHGNNPVLDWVAGNVVVNVDARGMKRIDKQASSEKIDPMAAILNALSEAMVAQNDESPASGFFV
jgi:phage terminase large subunit-like protein